MRVVVSVEDGVTRHPMYRMAAPVNFTLLEKEQLAIIGDNGSGKSMFVDIITGKHPLLGEGVKYDFGSDNARMVCDNIKYVSFEDTYGTDSDTKYYQMRWNCHEEDNTPFVYDVLESAFEISSAANSAFNLVEYKDLLYDVFGISKIYSLKLSMLSSGERRKLHLIRALLSNPKLLIIDNPFIGLDSQARILLVESLELLVNKIGLQIILVVSRDNDIPNFITHVVKVEELRVGEKLFYSDYINGEARAKKLILDETIKFGIANLPQNDESFANTIVECYDVTVSYGKRTILDKLNFKILNGERWALIGENGSGKSTLLSLVCADNLQSYSNNIILFDYVRGTGESIWDIKKHIGYVSPELHRSYLKDYPAIDVVASGLSDSVGLYKRPRPDQISICEFWMKAFGVLKYKHTSFLLLSSGEQRLVLLARAFVKDPSLLILDEPFHGLDQNNCNIVREIIEEFCYRRNKTLIMVSHYDEDFPPFITHTLHLKRLG